MLVWREHGGAAVGGEIRALGIGDQQAASGPGAGEDREIEDAVAQDALRVVGQHDDLGGVDVTLDRVPDGGGGGAVERIGDFLVEAEELMRSGHEAGLRGGRASGEAHHGMGDSGCRLDEPADLLPGLVVADDADEDGLAAEGGDVQRDVRGAPEGAAIAGGPQDRDRRFRREPLDGPGNVAVEDDVADDQDSRGAEVPDDRGEFDVGRRLGMHDISQGFGHVAIC